LLHVTNGDHAVAMLRHAGMQGDILAWRDVLHEGPVRADLSLEDLSRERADFIGQAGWGDRRLVLESFHERDARIRQACRDDEVVLWFEHDLYDQLQLIQVLDALADPPPQRLSLVCEAEYLGTMTPARAAGLFVLRKEVTVGQLQAGRRAWREFRSPDPRVLTIDVPELRFLGSALRRLLEEYPWTTDGLSRLERAILAALEDGPRSFSEVFRAVREEPAFLGDTVLLWHLRRLQAEGAVEFGEGLWRPRSMPMRSRERWLGGVRTLPDGTWRFDPALGGIVVE
jgi:hypothetical protein